MYKKIPVVLLSIAMSLECTISSAFACDLPKFNGYNGEEVHLFILWENALKNKVNCKKIERDVEQNFEILDKYKITWSKDKIENNLRRLYNQGENFAKQQAIQKGCNKFLLIIVNVKNPKYEKRKLFDGSEEIVCTNVFDKKYWYRKTYLKGVYSTIHSTVTSYEADHDLTLLLGRSAEDFKATHNGIWNGKTIELNQDLFGASGWSNLNDLFYALNYCSNYVVLKNCNEKRILSGFTDIDLLCDSLRETAYAANAVKFVGKNHLSYYKIKVEIHIYYLTLNIPNMTISLKTAM